MDWIKVNDKDESTLPPLDKIVHLVYLSDYNDAQVIQLGGRTLGEDGWLWGVLDSSYFVRDWEPKLYGLEIDDDYRVTYWAEIEWPG